MELLNGWLLAAIGGAAAMIPLLLHLLSRRRAHQIDWGAMQFLQFSTSAKRRKLLLEEIILMIIRCGLLAILGFALCRPFLKNPIFDAALAGKSRDLVLILDGSFSMQVADGGANRFALARNAALRALDVLRPGDSVSVLLADEHSRTLCPPSYHPFEEARKAVRRAEPTRGALDAPSALLAAAAVLEETRNPVKEVLLVTDGQAAGWKMAEAAYWRQVSREFNPRQRPHRLHVLNVVRTRAAPDNLAIVEATPTRRVVGTDRPVGIRVVFQNFGRRPMVNHDLIFRIDDKIVSTEILEPIEPGKTLTRVFWHRFKVPGGHRITVHVDHPDMLAVDDTATVAVNVRESLPVLIVNGDPGEASDAFSSETVFLRTALNPREEDPDLEEQLGVFIVAGEIAPNEVTAEAVRTYPVVILADVPRLTPKACGVLLEFVGRGGGLLIAPGDKLQATPFNAAGAALLPAVFEEPVGDLEKREEAVQVVSASLSEDGPLGLFRDRANTDIERAQIYRRHRLKIRDGSAVHGWMSDRLPFLTERRLGAGRVMVLAVPLDRHWTNLPRRNCYVPLVHRLISHLAAPLAGKANTAANRLVVPLEAAERVTRITLTTPTGHTELLPMRTVNGRPAVVYDKAHDRGLYRFEIQRADRVDVAFVNRPLDATESDLAGLPAAAREGVARQVTAEFYDRFAPLAARLASGSPGSEVWRWLVFGLLGMLVIEVFLTRRISRRQHMALAGGVQFGPGAEA